jgi:hypothetical protein
MKMVQAVCLAAVMAAPLGSPVAAVPKDAAADKVLAAAREAAGGEARLRAVQSLSISGKTKRQARVNFGGGEQVVVRESEWDADFLLPDKYVRKETSEAFGGNFITITSGFNGDGLIAAMESTAEMPMMPQGAQQGDPAIRVRRLRQEFARQWLAWLFEMPAASGITMKYAGTDTVGSATADVLEASGPDDFKAQLLIDQQTHRLLRVRYRATMPAGMRMQFGGPAGGGPPPSGGPPPGGEGRAPMQGPGPGGPGQEPPREIEIEVNYSDFRPVDGVTLPFKFTRSTNGQVNEETELKKVKINPSLKTDKFKVRS